MQIAVTNKSKRLSDRDVDAMTEACNQQVIECAAAYGIVPTPVSFYATDVGLPASNCRIMAIVDTIDYPGALGYHADSYGIVYGRVLAQDVDGTAITLSHECLEELVDPGCDAWRDMGAAHSVALEVCDPVEGDAYPAVVTILGEHRQVLLSNYVLPRWFAPDGNGRFDRMGKLTAPFTMTPGGYMIVRDAAGNEESVFARNARARAGGDRGRAALGTKLGNPDSRLYRRLLRRASAGA